jgi:Protein of unknown function (DUF1553)/Protein of unknown function (DUF1549)/Planctomycete cytochrome C
VPQWDDTGPWRGPPENCTTASESNHTHAPLPCPRGHRQAGALHQKRVRVRTLCYNYPRLAAMRGIHTVLLLALAAAPSLPAQTFSPGDLQFFETEIQPILAGNCQVCHNENLRSSGLAFLSRDTVLKGGNRGPAVVPGDAANSLLLKAVKQTGDLKMPPTGKLPDEKIAALEQWITRGLPWAAASESGAAKKTDLWSLHPIQKTEPPAVQNTAWVRNPIDRFVLARLENEGIQPSPEAERSTLIRRVSLDLIGLPPSPAEVEQFVNDKSPDAYERLVDRLLASEHYGERWGRHWLDAARYADSDGYTIDGKRDMWKYRDWVISALNRDEPFDQFTIEQLAGDLLPNPTTDQIVATGFNRNTLLNQEGGIDFEQYRVEAVVDRVSTTGAVFLGLTLGCARCHDHKFDPLSQREFYQMYSFFNNVDELAKSWGEEGRSHAQDPVLEFGTPEQLATRDIVKEQIGLLNHELDAYKEKLLAKQADWEAALTKQQIGEMREEVRGIFDLPKDKRNDIQLQAVERIYLESDLGYRERQAGVDALRKRLPDLTTALVMRELPEPRQAYIQLSGDFLRHGADVEPGVPAVLPPLQVEGRPTRLDLARWLVSRNNPLTARVTVNRVWQRYFGKGIVDTQDDFGTQGTPPTHPKLLDWLATEFVDRGWSLKAMHRLIVTSATYRQSSGIRPDLQERDPANQLLARQTRLRLDSEILRDNALAAAGLLSAKVGGPSVFPPQPEGASKLGQIQREWKVSEGEDRYRRGLYTHFWRSSPDPGLMVFDAPNSTTACTRRARSNTPLQALTLLNDEAYVEAAEALAARVLKEAPAETDGRLRYAFELCTAREPDATEQKTLSRFVASQLDDFQTDPKLAQAILRNATQYNKEQLPQLAAWTATARVLLNLDEFITRE